MFLAALPGYVTHHDICLFPVFKEKNGKILARRNGCQYIGQKGQHDCGCPLRLSCKTVDSYIGKLPTILHFLGRDGEWDRHLDLGNPAADKSVKDYLRLVTAEQLQARVTPKQATPFFVDKLTQLYAHTWTGNYNTITITIWDLGQMKVLEILRFPNGADQHSLPYLILGEQESECYEIDYCFCLL